MLYQAENFGYRSSETTVTNRLEAGIATGLRHGG